MSWREGIVAGRDTVLSWCYRYLLKPIYFRFDPESVHGRLTQAGRLLGHHALTREMTRIAFGYEHPMLATTLAGIPLRNPVGLSAGFDKEGQLIEVMPAVGFGFMEIGSITGSPSAGNPKPRLWRLPKSNALVVHLGLNSSGSAAVATRLRTVRPCLPVGISIAKANHPEYDSLEAGLAEYRRAAEHLRGLGAFRVINISCPNTTGGEPFAKRECLRRLLTEVMPVVSGQPVFVKLPVDVNVDELNAILDECLTQGVTGFICTNLTKKRDLLTIHDAIVPPRGGISGKVVEPLSNEALAHVYRWTGGRVPLIGVGGIFTAEDAYRKIRLGATAVQLITGMIYRGPMVVSEIKRGLVRLLRADGFRSVAEAVGVDSRR